MRNAGVAQRQSN